MCLGVRGLNLSHSSRASWRRRPDADLEAWEVSTQGVRIPIGGIPDGTWELIHS